MLSGGEKAKVRRLVAAINKKYPEVMELLEKKDIRNNAKGILELQEVVRDVFKWTSNLSYLLIKNNRVLFESFQIMQEACRNAKANVKNKEEVAKVFAAVDAIYDMHKELIKLVDLETDFNQAILKQIIDELDLEQPKLGRSNKKDNSKHYSSIDDLFADLED